MSASSNKYHNFPPRKQVSVGEVCLLCECNRQVRKSAQKYVHGTQSLNIGSRQAMVLPLIVPGMIFSGVNNLTGENEAFQVCNVLWGTPIRSVMKRIK